MRRKNGFSLVELLIVLAVIAALIAVVTPIALNAISKAKATQVAENLKTIGSSLENKAYVDGVGGAGGLQTGDITNAALGAYVKDVQADYTANVTGSNGTYTITVVYGNTNVDTNKVYDILGSNYITSSYTYQFQIVVY